MSVHQIWAAVVTAVTVVAAVVVLSIFKSDAKDLMVVIVAVVSPIVSALITIKVVGAKVDNVDSKVNGHLTALTDKIPNANVGE